MFHLREGNIRKWNIYIILRLNWSQRIYYIKLFSSQNQPTVLLIWRPQLLLLTCLSWAHCNTFQSKNESITVRKLKLFIALLIWTLWNTSSANYDITEHYSSANYDITEHYSSANYDITEHYSSANLDIIEHYSSANLDIIEHYIIALLIWTLWSTIAMLIWTFLNTLIQIFKKNPQKPVIFQIII